MRFNQSQRLPWIYSFLLASTSGCLAATGGCNSSVAQDESTDAAGDKDGEKGADENDANAKSGEKEEQLQVLELARGRLVLQVPTRWEKQQPRSRITQLELSVPAKDEKTDDDAGEDAEAGRLTVTAAGGSIDANVDRWIGQFKQPDGKSSREVAKIEKKEYDGLKVHLFDLAGTFVDRRGGPFNPAAQTVELENHRMLAAIIETDGAGYYFIKFTGPQETVEQNAAPFWRAVEGLEWK